MHVVIIIYIIRNAYRWVGPAIYIFDEIRVHTSGDNNNNNNNNYTVAKPFIGHCIAEFHYVYNNNIIVIWRDHAAAWCNIIYYNDGARQNNIIFNHRLHFTMWRTIIETNSSKQGRIQTFFRGWGGKGVRNMYIVILLYLSFDIWLKIRNMWCVRISV